MKRFLPLLTGFLLAGTVQVSAADLPEKIYMVGSFNNWSTPLNTPDSEYILTDPDGDGVYTGSFKTEDSYMSFKLFTAVTDWGSGDSKDVYGLASRPFDAPESIYSNAPYKAEVVSDASIQNGGTQDISVSNLTIGVTINVEAAFNTEGIALTLSSPDQGEAKYQEGVVLIGDFNDWQLPASADNLNGAIPAVRDEENPFVFTIDHDFKAGDISFIVLTTNNYRSFSYYGPQEDQPAFSLKNLKGESPAEFYSSFRQWSKTRYTPVNIKDWTGGEITFKYRTDTRRSCTYSAAAPSFEPIVWYAIVKAEGKDPYLAILDSYQMENRQNSYINNIQEQSAEILFTTENSLTPAKENIYGMAKDTTFVKTDYLSSELVKGGNPIKVDFRREGDINVYIENNFDIISVSAYMEKLPTDVEHLWLNGYQVGWISPIEANADLLIEFDLIEPGVFGKIVECPYVEQGDDYVSAMQFRFFTGLAGWTDEYSLGSDYADFYCLPADMEGGSYSSPMVERGLGNWGLTNWTGGPVYMKVDLTTMTLHLSDASSVETIESAPADNTARYFNLQGTEVKNPDKGIYIKVSGNKSEKVVF